MTTVVYQQAVPVITRNGVKQQIAFWLLLLGLTVAVSACAPSANPPKDAPAPSPTSS